MVWSHSGEHAAAAAKLLQSCPNLCDPIDGSPLGSAVPGILQARTLEWVAISFSNAWKWKVKSLSRSVVSNSSQPHGLQPTRLLHPWDFAGKSAGVGCHCLLRGEHEYTIYTLGSYLGISPPTVCCESILKSVTERLLCKALDSWFHQWIKTHEAILHDAQEFSLCSQTA